MKFLMAATVCAIVALTGNAAAQELPATTLKVMGGMSTRAAYKEVELPFWSKTIPENSHGQVTAEIKGFDEMGIKGPELFRMMKQGVIEFGSVPLSYFYNEIPANEAIDLAGLVPDAKVARAMVDAFTPELARIYAANYQAKLLGVTPYGPQVLFCNGRISGLSDLRGKKVRTVTRSQADVMEALGAISVNIASNEVVPAFRNKTIHCAVSATMVGYSAKWYEAATHLYALPVGWNQEVHAVNQKAWDQLDPRVQTFLQTNIAQLIDSLWLFSAKQNLLGIACNTGTKACPFAARGKMTLVLPTQADLATFKRVATQKMLPKWAARCSVPCVTEFNKTVGKVAGVVAKK